MMTNTNQDKKGFPSLLTVQDVVEILNLGRSTVYLLVQRGELRCIRIGRAIRIHPDVLQSFIRSSSDQVCNKWDDVEWVFPALDETVAP